MTLIKCCSNWNCKLYRSQWLCIDIPGYLGDEASRSNSPLACSKILPHSTYIPTTIYLLLRMKSSNITGRCYETSHATIEDLFGWKMIKSALVLECTNPPLCFLLVEITNPCTNLKCCQLNCYHYYYYHHYSWWRHQIQTFSALLAIYAGYSPASGEFPHEGQWRGALMFSLICV